MIDVRSDKDMNAQAASRLECRDDVHARFSDPEDQVSLHLRIGVDRTPSGRPCRGMVWLPHQYGSFR